MHLKEKFTLNTAMEAQSEVEVQLYSFLSPALDGGGCQRFAPAALPQGNKPVTHCTEGWVSPRAGLEGCRKSRPQLVFDPRAVWPVAGCYADYAIPTHTYSYQTCIFSLHTLPYAFRLQ